MLNFLRTVYTVFHSGCTNLHSQQQCTSSLFSISSPKVIFLFDNSHSKGVRWYLIVILICTSLMIMMLRIFSHVSLLSGCLLKKNVYSGTSLVGQWLRHRAPNAGGPGSIPGQGTRSHMHAATKEPGCHN